MANWIWPDEKTIFDLHDRNIDEFGGGHGIRDINVIKSAIATPKDLALYEPKSDAADLAARYAYHLVKNHGFMDGNKRTGYVASQLFLELNGYVFTAAAKETFDVLLDVANNDMTREQLIDWYRGHINEATKGI